MDKNRYKLGNFVLDTDTSIKLSSKDGAGYAELPYTYFVAGKKQGQYPQDFTDDVLADRKIIPAEKSFLIEGLFKNSKIKIRQHFFLEDGNLCESITFTNTGEQKIDLDIIKLGFTADMSLHKDWRLCAVPFRVQLDGSIHDYSVEMLENSDFTNAVHPNLYRSYLPDLTEDRIVRSEAWAWGSREGIVIAKYSNINAELSVARPEVNCAVSSLIFGGAGFCLYKEPSGARSLVPGESYTFAPTVYMQYTGGINNAFYAYRSYIESKDHGFPDNYDPPVNWNVLYDVGWHHSNAKELKKNYTKKAILEQAGYAKECGCGLLYLDPGWEVAEGTTIWDEQRLGTVPDMIRILKEEYGMDLGYRTILFAHHKHDLDELWPSEYKVQLFKDKKTEDLLDPKKEYLRGICTVNDKYLKEKLKRILKITKQGIKFMMVDEMDWCGVCYSSKHSHDHPTAPMDHIKAVYDLVMDFKKECPGLLVEVHDPVWPWLSCNYLPTYYRQSRYDDRGYNEHWGFEYMWDCINDLKTGKAMALFYYNLGSSIPLYLHITMASDNDNCLFFWWAASTVRHLGIGGKNGHETVNPADLQPYDKDKRYKSYIKQMKTYIQIKPYLVRGTFIGIAENIHLHTLPGKKGGVVNIFNLTENTAVYDFTIPAELLGGSKINVIGADAEWGKNEVMITKELPPMTPGLIFIGDACK